METKLHTRIAGYKFSIDFHKETAPPTSITYNGCTMDIKYDVDLRRCKYCGRYGHLIGKCRTKEADDLIHKQHREETRDADYKKATEGLIAERKAEEDHLQQYLEDNLTAMADVYEAALTADYEVRKEATTTAYKSELGDTSEMFNDNMDLLQYSIENARRNWMISTDEPGGGGGHSRRRHGRGRRL